MKFSNGLSAPFSNLHALRPWREMKSVFIRVMLAVANLIVNMDGTDAFQGSLPSSGTTSFKSLSPSVSKVQPQRRASRSPTCAIGSSCFTTSPSTVFPQHCVALTRRDFSLAAAPRVTPSTHQNEGLLDKLPLSEETRQRLEQLEVVELTPIQQATFQSISDGRDVIGKASTGTGKTLAFCLPLIERLLAEKSQGKPSQPAAVILLPTRELAQQVERDFKSIAGKRLKTVLLVGGTAMDPQIKLLKEAPHVAIGTPGRIVDLIRSRHLSMSSTGYLVLDEADQMLEAGFADELDIVVDSIPRGMGVQCLLFCATLSKHLLAVGQRLCRNPDMFDVSAGEAPKKLRMLSLPVTPSARASVLVDLLLVHNPRRAIVFTNTKMEAVELAGVLSENWPAGTCSALHGDLPQFQRKRTMESFRTGACEALVATDVAARGLHIDGLDLVIHCGIPIAASGGARRSKNMKNVINAEQFVHRTGRTARMGASGTSILLYDPGAGETALLGALQRALKCEIEHADAPHAVEVYHSVGALAQARLATVPEVAAEALLPRAEELLRTEGPMALARAMAALGGVQPRAERSLIDSREGQVTVQAALRQRSGGGDAEQSGGGQTEEGGGGAGAEVVVPSMVMEEVRRRLGGKKVKLGRVWLCADGTAIFDVSAELAARLCSAEDADGGPLQLSRPTTLPKLAAKKKPPPRP